MSDKGENLVDVINGSPKMVSSIELDRRKGYGGVRCAVEISKESKVKIIFQVCNCNRIGCNLANKVTV